MEFTLVLIGAVALTVLVLAGIPIVLAVVRVVRRHAADRASPALQAEARVLDKRTQVRGGGDAPVEQRYFVTFQLSSGERLELAVSGTESGLLMPGDEGTVHWKGSRYLGFAREILR